MVPRISRSNKKQNFSGFFFRFFFLSHQREGIITQNGSNDLRILSTFILIATLQKVPQQGINLITDPNYLRFMLLYELYLMIQALINNRICNIRNHCGNCIYFLIDTNLVFICIIIFWLYLIVIMITKLFLKNMKRTYRGSV